MRILERYEAQIHESLHDWASEHTNSHERLTLLPIDPDTYKYQRVLEHTIHGNPLDPAVLDSVAQSIDSRYMELGQKIDEDPKPLRIAKAVLDSKQNLIIGTGHEELIDIGLFMAHVTSTLRHRDTVLDSSLMANKMAAYLGVKMDDGEVVPAPDILALAFNETYLTLPVTQSSKDKLSIPKRVIRAYNQIVLERGIVQRLKATPRLGKSMILGAALSGTVTKQLNVDEYAHKHESEDEIVSIKPSQQADSLVIGRANTGTLKFMSHALTMIAATQLRKEDIQAKISDEPLYIGDKEKLDDAMEAIATIKDKQDPTHHYVYDKYGNLPVTRMS